MREVIKMSGWIPVPGIEWIRIEPIEGREGWFEFESSPLITPTPATAFSINSSKRFDIYEIESYEIAGNTYIVRGEMHIYGEQSE
jgi:hypothetical protein